MDNSDLMEALEEQDRITKEFATVGARSARLRAVMEKEDAMKKTIIGFSFNSSEKSGIGAKDKDCYTSDRYKNHIISLTAARNAFYISNAELQGLKHRIEFLRQKIMVIQSLMKKV